MSEKTHTTQETHEIQPKPSFAVKLLAIIGFSATIVLIGWAILMLATKGQEGFSSLAERTEALDEYEATDETVTTEEDAIAETDDEPQTSSPNETVGDTEPVVVASVSVPPNTPPAPTTPTQPVFVQPQSNPYGYTDLKITTIGTGVITRGVFSFTSKYHSRSVNAVMIDVLNVGTKTSDYWSFTTELPDGTVYSSLLEYPLKPQEHAVFTIPFSMDRRDDERIASRVYTSYDLNASNNKTTWLVDFK